MRPNSSILISAKVRRFIESDGAWGSFTALWSEPDSAGAVIALSRGDSDMVAVPLTDKSHFLTHSDPTLTGRWFKVPREIAHMWHGASARDASVTFQGLKDHIAEGFLTIGESFYVALTFCPDLSSEEIEGNMSPWGAWLITGSGATPIQVDVELEDRGLGQFLSTWPVKEFASQTAIIAGAGSIGSVAAIALAGYGVGRLVLVDFDRLKWHNLIRHKADKRFVGKLKVDALAEELESTYPATEVVRVPASVVGSANLIRQLLAESDIVVGTTDGVEPRRVLSHLARRAKVTAILAAVLENGSLGEIVRLRPWVLHGCLQCRRRALEEMGTFDPEPGLDRPYGTGDKHLPMTAMPGDLRLVGELAAKVAAATIAEKLGLPDQRLPGEQALIALRPLGKWPVPYDLTRAGELKWLPEYAPYEDCVTCRP